MPRLRLQKPQQCTACGSDSLRQEFKPTRWICNDCDIVVVSRPSRPISGICLYCGAKKADGVIFVKGKNRCLECKSKLGRKWHTENRKPYQPGAARKSAQRSPEAFIKYLVGRVRSRSIQSKMRRGGLEIPAKKVETLRTVTITPGHMIEVFYQQQG